MKTIIIYESTHHFNTMKLVSRIVKAHPEVEAIEIEDLLDLKDFDINMYDRIGIGSGIEYGRFYEKIRKYMKEKLPEGKEVFFIFTAGRPDEKKHDAEIRRIAEDKHCTILGSFGCKGYDTSGPMRVIGGLNRGRPDELDAANAIRFYEGLDRKE